MEGSGRSDPAVETPAGGTAAEDPRDAKLREENSQLKRALADKGLEVDFFKGCLAKSRGSSPAEQRLWREGIYDQIREVMPMQGGLSIERMCCLAQVSRAGFSRFLEEKTPTEEEVEVRAAIQKIAIEHGRRYGYRRITAELRRQGMQVNRKRVARILRASRLLDNAFASPTFRT